MCTRTSHPLSVENCKASSNKSLQIGLYFCKGNRVHSGCWWYSAFISCPFFSRSFRPGPAGKCAPHFEDLAKDTLRKMHRREDSQWLNCIQFIVQHLFFLSRNISFKKDVGGGQIEKVSHYHLCLANKSSSALRKLSTVAPQRPFTKAWIITANTTSHSWHYYSPAISSLPTYFVFKKPQLANERYSKKWVMRRISSIFFPYWPWFAKDDFYST